MFGNITTYVEAGGQEGYLCKLCICLIMPHECHLLSRTRDESTKSHVLKRPMAWADTNCVSHIEFKNERDEEEC